MGGQLHAPAALPPGKEPRFSLDRRLGGPQNRSGRLGEEKILDPTGTLTPIPQSSNPEPVAIPTALSRLQYHTITASINPDSAYFSLFTMSNVDKY
jgi:hypothetical protein